MKITYPVLLVLMSFGCRLADKVSSGASEIKSAEVGEGESVTATSIPSTGDGAIEGKLQDCAKTSGAVTAMAASQNYLVVLVKERSDDSLYEGLNRGQTLLLSKGLHLKNFVRFVKALTASNQLSGVEVLDDLWISNTVLISATECDVSRIRVLDFVESVSQDRGGRAVLE